MTKLVTIEQLLEKPICMMSVQEFVLLLQNAEKQTAKVPAEVVPEKHYEYGIAGIAKIFGCSIPTANRIKKSGVIDAAPNHPSEATEKQPTKRRRLHQLWNHVWSDMVTSWWKCFAYSIALCSLVLAAALWYRQTQLEAVVKEYYIIKPVSKQDRKYAPLIHTMDSVILKDGIDEVCERVYGEKQK